MLLPTAGTAIDSLMILAGGLPNNTIGEVGMHCRGMKIEKRRGGGWGDSKQCSALSSTKDLQAKRLTSLSTYIITSVLTTA